MQQRNRIVSKLQDQTSYPSSPDPLPEQTNPMSSSTSLSHLKRNWIWLLATAALLIILTALLLAEISNQRNESPLSAGGEAIEAMATEGVPELTYELVSSSLDPKLVRYAAKEKLSDGTYQNVTVHRWVSLLVHHPELIVSFDNILSQTDMKAFFFETKGVSYKTAPTKSFEFVLVESSYLYQFADAHQDPTDFGDLLQCEGVGCVFPNLGGDSTLIAPTERPGMGKDVYGHLAAFVRRAPKSEQVLPFWKLALETLLRTLEENPGKSYWFSTDGTGVRWLHVRIDPRPKYYDYQPFANET